MKGIDAIAFINARSQRLSVDVRSPSEYQKGHIPGAVNLPLLSDDERAEVGTLYKQKGPEDAIKKGMEYVEPKKDGLLQSYRELAGERELQIYCWRGGMRSQSVTEHLQAQGLQVELLEGGYQNYRRSIFKVYSRELDIRVIGGYTGSGKTPVLQELADRGEQVIDLEDLACHRGSAFGNIPDKDQPESEHFNNLLAEKFLNLDLNRTIWLEDESLSIGKVYLNQDLFTRMQQAPWYFLDIPQEARVNYLGENYDYVSESMVEEILNRIQKRMGGQNVQAAREALKQGERDAVIRLLLKYYDKAYRHSTERKRSKPSRIISMDQVNPGEMANQILQ